MALTWGDVVKVCNRWKSWLRLIDGWRVSSVWVCGLRRSERGLRFRCWSPAGPSRDEFERKRRKRRGHGE